MHGKAPPLPAPPGLTPCAKGAGSHGTMVETPWGVRNVPQEEEQPLTPSSQLSSQHHPYKFKALHGADANTFDVLTLITKGI